MGRLIQVDMNKKFGRYLKLPERSQEAFWMVVDALSNLKSSVTLPVYTLDEVEAIYDALRYDYPELRMLFGVTKIVYTENKFTGITWHLKYCDTREKLLQNLKRIDVIVEDIILKSVRGKQLTDSQCVEAIYKTIAGRMVYSSAPYPDYAFTLECILHGNGVCAGIASVLAYTLGKLQIPVLVVNGRADGGKSRDNHAWNIVKMADGSYKHLDVTWDAGRQNTKYLALDDLAMRAKRHDWNVADYPVCI